jgi:hypothetical protein
MTRLLLLAVLALPCAAQKLDQFPIDSPGTDIAKIKAHPFTKKFVIAHGAFLGADILDIEMTQRGLKRPCGFVEGGFGGADRHPSRKEMYLTDGAIYAALFGFDALIQWAGDGDHSAAHKAFSWVPYMGPVYGTVLHLKGGIEWYQHCG